MTEPTNDAAAAANLDKTLSTIESASGGDFLDAFDPDVAAPAPDASQGDGTAPDLDDFFKGFDEDETTVEEATAEDATVDEDAPAADGEEDDYPDTAPGKGSETAQKGWKEIKSDLKKTRAELRTERDKAAAEIKTRETELENLRKQVAELPEFREKAKQAEEAEKELAVARVEGTREYKDTIDKPLRVIEDTAVVIAQSNGLKVDDILDALAEPDMAKQRDMIDDLCMGLKPADSYDLVAMSREARVILSKRAEIRSRAAEAQKELEQITHDKETKAQQKAREEFETATENAVAELKKRVPIVAMAEGETTDSVFSLVLSRAKASEIDKATPANKAFAAAAAVLLPRMAKQNVHLQAEIKKLQARVAESSKTRPTLSGGEPAAVAKEGDFLADVLGTGDAMPYKFL